jgi:hypothetical protein
MQLLIYIISGLLTGYVYSMATTILVVDGFDRMGEDIGSPGIMLFSLLCICGILSIVIASIMWVAKAKYQKEFPARFSLLIFLLTYFPIHIKEIWFPDLQLGFLEVLLGILLAIMMYFSYVPLFHMTAQGFTNLHEFVKRQELAGIRYTKFLVLGSIVVICLLIGWWMSIPEKPPSPNVMSLEKNWELLESGGREWHSDAYLNDIEFDVNEWHSYEISARYLSKSTPEESYSIEINESGKINKKETDKTSQRRETAKLPIKREEWTIGSEQAWVLFQKDSTINTCITQEEKRVLISLRLTRTISGRLVWELLIVDCPNEPEWSWFYLDAKTGKTVESYID